MGRPREDTTFKFAAFARRRQRDILPLPWVGRGRNTNSIPLGLSEDFVPGF